MTPVLLAAACALASAALVRLLRDFANRRALLDLPNDRSSHDVPRPRLGGVGVVAPVLATGGWLLFTRGTSPALAVPLVATGLVALLGLVDDLRPLPARVRFGVQVLLAGAVVGASWSRLPAAAGALGGWLPVPVLAALAVLWITWLTNLYNFMDGIDGIAGVQAVVASIALAGVAASGGAGSTLWLLVALAGSSAGFLLFNLPPASIFMGDVGSTAIGFLFGVLPLLPESAPGAHAVPLAPVALALSLFVLDATTTLVRRMARGEKVHQAHRTHLYQRPVVRGVSHRAVLGVAAAGMVVVAGCAVAWAAAPAAAPAGVRAGLALAPVLLFAAGSLAVRRIEG
jgi:Fuc2NAc and GlcNAc transferase